MEIDCYKHTNTKGMDYFLHKTDVKLRSGKAQTIYFFKRRVELFNEAHVPCRLPVGYGVRENPRNGFVTVMKPSRCDGKSFVCILCGQEVRGYGNNPAPLVDDGQCCDDCNAKRVIPARLAGAKPEKPTMTHEQRIAALELGDKLAAFAEQFKLSDDWIRAMYKQARVPAQHTTGLDINEA